MDFKAPSIIPQDLQLIQDIIGQISPSPPPPLRSSQSSSPVPPRTESNDSIDSSVDGDEDSEREVEADILSGALDEDDEGGPK